jgi:hypothetical protein
MSDAATLRYEPFGLGWDETRETAVRRSRNVHGIAPVADTGVDGTTTSYGSFVLDRLFFEHFVKLAMLRTKKELWPDESEPPSDLAIAYAQAILAELSWDRLAPSRVVASAEGGVAVCFVKGNKYSDIECLNNGSILGVTSDRRERPTVWEIDADPAAIARACSRIRKFLNT